MKFIKTDKNIYLFPNEINHIDFFHYHIVINSEDENVEQEKMLNAGFAYLNMEDKTIHTFGQSTSTGLYADGSSFSLNQLYFQKDKNHHYLSTEKHHDNFIVVSLELDEDKGMYGAANIIIHDNQDGNKLIDTVNKVNSSMYYSLAHN